MSQSEHTPSPFLISRLRLAPAARWFVSAAVGLLLFLGYTALVSTGVFDASTAQIERWLLQRPISRVDCLFYEWRNLGNTFLIVCLSGVLGLICFLLGYRWSVLPYLALLLFVCLVLEVIGKSNLTQSVPHSVTLGLASINCPQIHNQPASVRLSA